MPSQATIPGGGQQAPLFPHTNAHAKEPAVIESATDITEFNAESAGLMDDADVADWVEQRQVVLPADEDYPHLSRSEIWLN